MRAICAVLALALLGAQDPPEKKKPATQEDKERLAIERALLWITDPDPALREIARAQLLQFGKKSIPLIEERLKVRKVLDLVQILREIERPSEKFVTEADLTRDGAELGKNGNGNGKHVRKETEAFLRRKYGEALRYAHSKNYEKGHAMADAIVTLEPQWAEAEKVKRLRRYCDHMILQTTLLEATIVQDRLTCVEGQTVELTLRLKNLFKSDITIKYGKGTPQQPGTGLAVLQTEIELKELGGVSFSFSSHDEIRFENEIPIAPGAYWEKKYFLDTSLNLADQDQVRQIAVNAWSHPLEIETEGRKMTRRIQFAPALIKVVPRKYARFQEKPMESLGKLIDAGTVQEVFVCAQLLDEKEKDRGIEMLIAWMEKAESRQGRELAGSMLYHLTDMKLGTDPKKWRAWWEKRETQQPK